MSNERLTVTLRLPPDVRDRLANEARETGQSMNALIIERLSGSLPLASSSVGAIEQALRSASVSHHPLAMSIEEQVVEGLNVHAAIEEKVVQAWKENQFNFSLPPEYGHTVYLDRLNLLEGLRYRQETLAAGRK